MEKDSYRNRLLLFHFFRLCGNVPFNSVSCGRKTCIVAHWVTSAKRVSLWLLLSYGTCYVEWSTTSHNFSMSLSLEVSLRKLLITSTKHSHKLLSPAQSETSPWARLLQHVRHGYLHRDRFFDADSNNLWPVSGKKKTQPLSVEQSRSCSRSAVAGHNVLTQRLTDS